MSSSHLKLLGTVVDENTDLSHLVELLDNGSFQWFELAAEAVHQGESDKLSKGDLITIPHLEQTEEGKILDIKETAVMIPKGSLPYRESIFSLSSLESPITYKNRLST